jgi:hypothetical protein
MAGLPSIPITPAKPRLDGRCEWQRGGLAFAVHPTRGLIVETIEACMEPAVDGKTEWCAAHKCREDGCRLARVAGEVCVGHQPGSLKSARTARLAAIGAAE